MYECVCVCVCAELCCGRGVPVLARKEGRQKIFFLIISLSIVSSGIEVPPIPAHSNLPPYPTCKTHMLSLLDLSHLAFFSPPFFFSAALQRAFCLSFFSFFFVCVCVCVYISVCLFSVPAFVVAFVFVKEERRKKESLALQTLGRRCFSHFQKKKWVRSFPAYSACLARRSRTSCSSSG